jgi:hypothetical protein
MVMEDIRIILLDSENVYFILNYPLCPIAAARNNVGYILFVSLIRAVRGQQQLIKFCFRIVDIH